MRKMAYSSPPDAVYRLGKRKQALTIAIKTLQSVLHEVKEEESVNMVVDVILMLKRRREKLDEV